MKDLLSHEQQEVAPFLNIRPHTSSIYLQTKALWLVWKEVPARRRYHRIQQK
jgi:hypothetical protein